MERREKHRAKLVLAGHRRQLVLDRIRVERLGSTVGGRPFIAATIASPDTLRNLDRYRTIQARLADPRQTTILFFVSKKSRTSVPTL